ncbi:SusC/RagA family TonB-linked outer membrane protein [Pararcticibacter amylolyticus]|nr:TonB-dependent receptor [Pararcticibacter amylolyticus]
MSNLNANLLLNYKLLDHLTLRSSFGYNTTINNDRRITPMSAQNPSTFGLNGQSSFGTGNFKNWIAEPQIEYSASIGKGTLDVLGGATYNKRNNTTILTTGRNYSNDDLLGTLAGAGVVNGTNTFVDYNYQAFFGRINYNWGDKYIVNLTGRRDGSSRFASNQRFSNFGAVGAAWLFSNENFLKDSKIISYGKLRGSYGKTGNDQIQDYYFYDSWSPGATYADSTTLAPTRLYNPALHWEANQKAEVAIELGLLKDRFVLTTALYRNISSDPLVQYPLPSVAGFKTITSNLNGVRVENRGIEIALSTKNFNGEIFKWSTDFNIAVPQNKLLAYPNLETSTYASTYTIGKSLNQLIGYQFTGVDPKTGLYTIQDADNNGAGTSADFQPLQNTDPKYYGGMNNSFSYKGFTLSFFLQFTKQLGVHWRTNNLFNSPGTAYNVPVEALDRWQTEDQITDVQKFTTSSGSIIGTSGFFAMMFSSAKFTDASFLRLKNASLTYELPSEWIRHLGMRSGRFYIQGQNLITITGYKVSDPEIQNYTIMAPLRTIAGGLQFTL